MIHRYLVNQVELVILWSGSRLPSWMVFSQFGATGICIERVQAACTLSMM
jgi:hypothetical protein